HKPGRDTHGAGEPQGGRREEDAARRPRRGPATRLRAGDGGDVHEHAPAPQRAGDHRPGGHRARLARRPGAPRADDPLLRPQGISRRAASRSRISASSLSSAVGSGGGASTGRSKRRRIWLKALTTRNMANATMRKLMTVLRKAPYWITGAPAATASGTES